MPQALVTEADTEEQETGHLARALLPEHGDAVDVTLSHVQRLSTTNG